jgi:membrane-bound acyltransferase YfiQ involved in biofilm formation
MTKMLSGFVAFIGNYSLSIYLFHVFFTAASRFTAKSTGINGIWLLFVPGTTLGTAGPILVEVVASRYDITQTLLLGKRPADRKQTLKKHFSPVHEPPYRNYCHYHSLKSRSNTSRIR